MRKILLLVLGLLIAPASPRAVQVPAPASARRLVLVSWDGAGAWLIDRLLSENKLPNLAKIRASGVHADYVTPAFPSNTLPGHAALWTGASGEISGIANNNIPSLPRGEHTLLEGRGSKATLLDAEPISVTAALAGKRVATLNAPVLAPAAPFVDRIKAAGVAADRFVSLDAWRVNIAPARIATSRDFQAATGWSGLNVAKERARSLSLTIGERTLHVAAFDAPEDPVDGFDTVLVCPDKKTVDAAACATLKPSEAAADVTHWTKPFRVTQGDLAGLTYFRLFALSLDGSQITLFQREANGLNATVAPGQKEEFLNASGGYADAPFNLYEQGQLGTVLWRNGDGGAERRLLEIVRFETECLKRASQFALRQFNPDLLIAYASASDTAGHYWMGALDPSSSFYNSALAGKLWPFYAGVLQLQDEWLGELLEQAGSGAVVSVVSDHGMTGVGRALMANVLLEKAGLLARSPDGKIDLSRTKALEPPFADMYIAINTTDWKEGIVPPAEREAVLQQVTEVLLSAIDPETGKHIVTWIARPDQFRGLGLNGPNSGDLYYDLADNYQVQMGFTNSIVGRLESPGSGIHGLSPFRSKMQSIWYAAGPGLKQGRSLGGLRQIDLAPTLSQLLGIPAPAQAQGRVIADAFANPVPAR